MCAAKNTKLVKLRAFRFENNQISEASHKILDILSQKLSNTTAQQRRKVLNSEEENKEEDLISINK